ARRAGLQVGDRVLAADGVALRTIGDYDAATERFVPGRPVALRVRRGDRELTVAVRPGIEPDWASLAIAALSALAYLGIALLSAVQGRQGDARARLLFAFTAAVALELVLPIDAVGDPALVATALAAYFLLTGVQVGASLHLASLTPESQPWLRRAPWAVPLFYATGLAVGALGGVAALVEGLGGGRGLPWRLATVDGLLQGFGLPLWAFGVCLLLAREARRFPEPRGRHQAALVLAGALPWLFFAVASSVNGALGMTLPLWLARLEPFVHLSFPVAFFAAIFGYHLFDLELAARRGLTYTLLSGSLIVLLYGVLAAAAALLPPRFKSGPGASWTPALAALLLGLLFSPLRRALGRFIGHRFFPERDALQKRLVALVVELPALGKLPRMAGHLVAGLRALFQTRSATLLIAEPETGALQVLATVGDGDAAQRLARAPLFTFGAGELERLKRAVRPLPTAQIVSLGTALEAHLPGIDTGGLTIPLLHQERLTGALLLGRKEGSRGFPAEELDLLNLLSHHVATVFENARLFESATYEGLTGLLRREAILAQLDRELERAARYERPLTVAMADLDHFKEVNDRHGHLAGDTLLKRIAQVLASGLRSTDWIGRYGGEEFLLVLPETDRAGAVAVAEKIRALVQRTTVPIDDGRSLQVTVSIGLAALSDLADERATSRALLSLADRSLYAAKHGGRNRIHPAELPPPALLDPLLVPS
ncbi:MAG TPA: diguanylate cyclase, partial [Thermoanaerobaculia bacterium]